jgi:hypothetical protein
MGEIKNQPRFFQITFEVKMKFLEALSQQGEHKLTSSLVRVLAVKRRASKNLVKRLKAD